MKEPIIKTFAVGYLQTNCYVVSDGFICVVIDPGGSADKIKKCIEENGWRGVAVLLTHGHFDHIMALSSFVQAGYKVYIHQNDEKMLHNEGNLADTMGLPPLPAVTPDGVLHDGDTLSFGELTFRVIHTPGHTKGSCCYELGKYLFSGDTLFYHSHGRTDFPGGNDLEMIDSLKKIFALTEDKIVLPGHEEDTTLSSERAFFAEYLI